MVMTSNWYQIQGAFWKWQLQKKITFHRWKGGPTSAPREWTKMIKILKNAFFTV